MHADVILRLLPTVYAETHDQSDALQGLLGVMEFDHDEPEQIVADIDRFFRPTGAPDRFLPALAGWVDLAWLLTGEQQAGREPYGPGSHALRQLIAQARVLSDRRGTAAGLISFLETAIGVAGFAVNTSADRPFHIEVTAPAGTGAHRALIERIVAEQKPVCSTHHVAFVDPADGSAVPAESTDPSTESDPSDDR